MSINSSKKMTLPTQSAPKAGRQPKNRPAPTDASMVPAAVQTIAPISRFITENIPYGTGMDEGSLGILQYCIIFGRQWIDSPLA